MATATRPAPTVSRVKLDTLKKHPRNPRQGDIGALMQSLSDDDRGQYRPLTVQRETPRGAKRNVILTGNHTYEAMLQLGWDDALVVELVISDAAGLRLMLDDNRASDLAGYDTAELGDILSELGNADQLGLVLWDGDDVDQLLTDLAVEEGATAGADDDALVDLPEKSYVKPGDLWLLGTHRLLCGDATNPDAVARLLDGATPQLMVTDPPYGVGYDPVGMAAIQDGASRPRSGASPTRPPSARARGSSNVSANRRGGRVANDDRSDWAPAWALSPADVAYVWHSGLHGGTVADGLTAAGYGLRAQVIWVKPNSHFSLGDYHWQHEPCWYVVKGDATARRGRDRTQTTVWTIDSVRAGKVDPGDDEATEAGTQKPMECMQRPMRNHLRADVYDPFVGSGTTIIAAERLGRRRVYAMDIDPRYVQMAKERWEKATGQTATKETA